jgi:prepilin-type N-terminal cleavage/methylation domain-containing protein
MASGNAWKAGWHIMVKSEKGYSLIEMMMVVVISLVTAAIAIPTTANTIANMSLRGAASSFASLAQQGRLAAVQKNATYTLLFGTNNAYVDLNGNSSYNSGEPIVEFGGKVNQASAPTGSNPTKVDATGGPLGWTATSGNVSFNARGLPCNSSASPCGTNVNYIFYFTDNRAFGANGWAAVSITAAGRIKQWWWNGSSWIS